MKFLILALALMASFLTPKAEAQSGGYAGERFQKVIYLAFGGNASCKGISYSCPKPIATGNLWAIPAGAMVDKVYVMVDTIVTGTTAFTVGDTDSAAGYVPFAALTLGTVGLYGYDAKGAGSYLRIQTAGVTDPADVYVVPTSKYYTAAGKFLTVANTTTNTAGRMRIVVEGSYLGLK